MIAPDLEAALRAEYGRRPIREIAERLGVPTRRVELAAESLGFAAARRERVDSALRANIATMTVHEIAKSLGESGDYVGARAAAIGAYRTDGRLEARGRRRAWTQRELAVLRALRKEIGFGWVDDAAERLGRSPSSIRGAARQYLHGNDAANQVRQAGVQSTSGGSKRCFLVYRKQFSKEASSARS